MKRIRAYTLQQICEQHRYTLIDTSCLSNLEASERDCPDFENEDRAEFIKIVTSQLVLPGGLYITKGVRSEINNFLRIIKQKRHQTKRSGNTYYQYTGTGLDRLIEAVGELMTCLRPDKIINLGGKSKQASHRIYQEYHERNGLKYLQTRFNLSDVDYELLITALALSSQENTALLTNDYGILCANEKIVEINENLTTLTSPKRKNEFSLPFQEYSL